MAGGGRRRAWPGGGHGRGPRHARAALRSGADDGATYATVLAVVVVAVALAACIPARQVSRVDPQALLRRP